MSILFENCDLLLRGEDGGYSTLHGFLGVRGDTIDYIGTEKPTGEYEEHKSMEHKLLMPGLINCHNHSPMVLLRGVGSGLPLREWLFDKVFPIEDRLVPADIAAGSRLAILEMLASGTTSFSDMYFFPAETVAAVAEAGMKANISRCVQCFDENQTVEQNTQIPESLALFEKYHGAADGRIHIDFSIHAEYTCKSHIVKVYSDLCREKGGRMHIHLAETAREQRECIERYGKTPTEWFESLGTFDSPTAAAHCVAVTERDMDILKAHGVSVIHNNLNMFEEMHLAEIMHDGYHNDPTLISTQEVLDMATVNGAKLQGRDDTGVLAVGKKADIIAIDLSKPHLYPNFDTPALLTCSAQAGDVCMTMVDGNILYENGEFKTLDENKVRADMECAVERLYRK